MKSSKHRFRSPSSNNLENDWPYALVLKLWCISDSPGTITPSLSLALLIALEKSLEV